MNATETHSPEILNVPTAVLIVVIGTILSSFCVVTYLMALLMDMLRS